MGYWTKAPPEMKVSHDMHQPLTALDRCDRCGAQAYAVTQHSTLQETAGNAGYLYWCAHHLRLMSGTLTPFLVLDETSSLREPVKT